MKRQVGRATLVVDLGYGDCGKGTVTDHYVRATGADLVVRFNGGAQAGHAVVTADGRAHTFSQFGAGSFLPGVRTYLSRFMVVHPGGLLREAEVLEGKGVERPLERLVIDHRARLITPFHQAANRLREVLRGEARHGSCGLGIGETMQDDLEHPGEVVRAQDLSHPEILRAKLVRWQQRKWEAFAVHRCTLRTTPEGRAELEVLESADIIERWIAEASLLAARVSNAPELSHITGSVVFEGAQGVLLDEWRGFHPHTTWSTCTFDNALEMLQGWDGEVRKVGVLRSYATRHGAGPFPTETEELNFPEPHNRVGPWQGAFRQGWFDAVTARYAVAACRGIDGLALTHLDRVPSSGLWKLATGYEGIASPYYTEGALELGPFADLDYQACLTEALCQAKPIYAEAPLERLRFQLEETLEAPIVLESWGATAQDKREIGHAARDSSAA